MRLRFYYGYVYFAKMPNIYPGIRFAFGIIFYPKKWRELRRLKK